MRDILELTFDEMIEDAYYDEMPDKELFDYLGCTIKDDRKGHEIPFSKVKEALTLGYMSRLVYHSYQTITGAIKKCTSVPADQLKLLSEINNPITDTEGFIAEYPNYAIVALRGTEGLTDMINDLVIKSKTVNGIKFHKGFYDTLDSVYTSIKEHLKSPISQGKTIYITGHSLGGALATILTYRLAVDYPQHSTQLKLYAYGSPAVATIGLQNKFKESGIESFAITVIGDIVSYERCLLYEKLHSWYDYYKAPNTVYLPHKGTGSLNSHKINTYISQLESIQTQEGYNKEYNKPLLEYEFDAYN